MKTAQAATEVDEVELEIEKLVAGGDGLGRINGLPVFVPRSAPGDLLRVTITQRRTHYLRADILEVIKEGPGRREAPCPHFSECGGCDLQHLEDEVQTTWRVRAGLEALTRIGGVDPATPLRVVKGQPFGYRLRTQLHLDGEPSMARLGYFGRGTHELVPIRACPVLDPELENLALRIPEHLTARVPTRIDVAIGDSDATCAPKIDGLPSGEVRRRIGEFEYSYDARCFFQAHRSLTKKLVEAVVGDLTGKTAFDLYAGVGLFSLPLTRRYERVVAVESDRIAARHARTSARRNQCANLEVVSSAVESWIDRLQPDCSRVVVDPPRRGLPATVVGRLRTVKPEALTYVSCHPAALARDLRRLGDYFKLVQLVFVDMFPQTGHLEIVAHLARV